MPMYSIDVLRGDTITRQMEFADDEEAKRYRDHIMRKGVENEDEWEEGEADMDVVLVRHSPDDGKDVRL